jgi:hypothetical protein
MSAPDLYTIKQNGKDVPLPIESTGATGETAYLKIDLQIDRMFDDKKHTVPGKPVAPVTAVFSPDPALLKGEVDILLWLHGDKRYFGDPNNSDRGFEGETIQFYLNEPGLALTKLREFILLQSARKKFILVAPTLNDRTGMQTDKKQPGGLLWTQTSAEAYLQQALDGASKHLAAGAALTPGNIVLAAHSGGGHIQTHIAGTFSGGLFDRMDEVWCFDSSYWGSALLETWAKKGHSDGRLFVYSSGGSGPSATGDYAEQILKDSQPKPPPKPKRGEPPPPPPRPPFGSTQVDVCVDGHGAKGLPLTTPFFDTTYKGSARGHYQAIKQYLTRLVETSQNLGKP